jgi:hypothetical protein
MTGRRRLACLALLALCGLFPAHAADPCTSPETYTASSVAARIAAAACSEHRLWFRPFIDAEGRLAGSRVREAETTRLGNGQPAWERVIEYWRDSGLLWQTQAASACGGADGIGAQAWCRGFVVDTPWSAAFVAWVMQKAAVPGYRGSASHVSYVRRAYRDPLGNAYRVSYPLGARPAQGDLLCYARVPSRTYGFEGLMAQLAGDDGGLNMHCDVVVGLHAGTVYLVGGNVFDGVTMRMLPLDAAGRLSRLPLRSVDDAECAPERAEACDMNRQDWAVLLELRPESDLAALRGAAPAPAAGEATAGDRQLPGRCCVECVPEDTAPPCASDGTTPPR